MTKDQWQGIAERVLTILATYLVAKGYITTSQVGDIVNLGLAVAAVGYGFYINRPTAIAQSAAALPGTTVITTPDIAKATPDNNNIISNTENKAVVK